MNLVISMGSMLFFGYYSDLIIGKFTRKNLFVLTNAMWIIPYRLIGLSMNYAAFLIFICIGAIANIFII